MFSIYVHNANLTQLELLSMLLDAPSNQYPSQQVVDGLLLAVSCLSIILFHVLINNLVSTSANQRNRRLDLGWCTLGGHVEFWLYLHARTFRIVYFMLWQLHDFHTTALWLLCDMFLTIIWLLYDYCMNPAWRSPNQMCDGGSKALDCCLNSKWQIQDWSVCGCTV